MAWPYYASIEKVLLKNINGYDIMWRYKLEHIILSDINITLTDENSAHRTEYWGWCQFCKKHV